MVFALISAYWLDNSCGKCKKTKTFGLVLLFHLPGRVAHFIRNPALSKDQPLRGSRHNWFLLSRTRRYNKRDRDKTPYVLDKAKIQEDAIYTNCYVVDDIIDVVVARLVQVHGA